MVGDRKGFRYRGGEGVELGDFCKEVKERFWGGIKVGISKVWLGFVGRFCLVLAFIESFVGFFISW